MFIIGESIVWGIGPGEYRILSDETSELTEGCISVDRVNKDKATLLLTIPCRVLKSEEEGERSEDGEVVLVV